MKKRALSLFLAVVFCFGLLPAGALAENDDTQTGGTTVLSADDAPDGGSCHHNDYDWTYTLKDNGTHTVRCSECGYEWDEDCFTESTLSDILPNGEAGHTLQCICGREKTEAHTLATHPDAYPTADGKGHSYEACSVCGVVTGNAEAHTYDENGRCETCGFKPVFEDSEGNLYDFDGVYSTEALNEVIQNGITSFKLVNFAQGEDADTTTVDAVFGLETDADVTLDMNGKTLTYASGEPTLTVSVGKLTVQGAATIQQTGQSQEHIKSAVKVTGGELIFKDDLTASGSEGRNAATPAIEVSGGKVTFKKNVTAIGGLQGVTGNTMTRQPAIHAMGGELDFQGDLDLNGGLTITGGAKLTRKLTQGKFYTNDSETGCSVSVNDSDEYQWVRDLLAADRVFANVDKTDSNRYFNGDFRSLSWNVAIEAHEHRYVDAGNYHSCECGSNENHTYDSSGACSVCSKACPHETATQSPTDHYYYCDKCNAQMFAMNTKGTRGSADFQYAYFANFANAMNAAEDGWTVKLLADIDNNRQDAIICGDNKAVTLDLNGHTINGGWIFVGVDGDAKNFTSSKLKIVGSGSFITTGLLRMSHKAMLDLSEWTGGTISKVSPYQNGSEESTLISGENKGTINSLVFYSWPSNSINNTKLTGGTYGYIPITMNYPVNSIAFSDLLADGYAFQYVDSGEFVDYAAKAEYENGGGSISNVKVVKCTAHVNNNNDNLCDYCNTDLSSAVATSVLTGGKTCYYTTLADAVAEAKDDDVITLRKKVTLAENENITIRKNITLDLNGKALVGNTSDPVLVSEADVTIRDGANNDAGGSVSNTATGYAVSAAQGGKLTIQGGTFTSLSNSNGGIGDLLANGYAFRNSSGKWLTENDLTSSTASNVIAARAPITAIEYAVTGGSEFEYGSSATAELLATAQPYGSSVEYRWYKDNTLIDGAAGDTYTITDLATLPVGEHTYRVEATRDGYTKSAEKTITITKIDLAKAEIVFTYGNSTVFWPDSKDNSIGATYAPLYTVTLGGKTLGENKDYEVVQGRTTGVGPQTLEIRAKEGTNYTGTKTAGWIVNLAKLKTISINGSSMLNAPKKAYDGTVALPNGFIASFEAPELWCNLVTLTEGTDYTLDKAEYATADVGEHKPVNITITLKNPNYVFDKTVSNGTTITVSEDGKTMTYSNWTPTNKSANFAIDPIDMPDFNKEVTLDVINDLKNTYAIDLPELPALEDGKTYGEITYSLPAAQIDNGYYTPGNAKVENGKLILTINKNPVKTTGLIGNVKVTVTTTNYKDVTLTVNLNAVNKRKLGMFVYVATDPVVYGMTLGDIKLSAEATDGGQVIPGTIAWEAPLTTVPAAGQATYRWTFTPDDTMQYLTASNTIRFSVDKATPTGEPKYTAITSGGKTLADAGLTVEGGTFSVPGTVKWADAADTAVKANTAYTWKFTPKDTVNYTELTGSITLYRVSSSGGGGGGSSAPTYKPSVAPSKDGTTAVSNPNPKKGDTVTITPKPADGNEVSKVIVTDKNGKTIEVKANADGTYRFVQPDSAVAIQVVYQPKQTVQTDFADVSAAHFAYDAVKWAAENGVTGGIGDNLFAPSQSCTRAQIVTFLWRAAGSPEPKSLSGLTDVPTDAYYAKAVAWAVENGITGGIGDGLFAPDATCTRAQSVTFLARALNAKANGKADFTDVPADSYYAEAVAWAVENGVTNGMGDNRFAPNRHCTRAQIVTFLYRAYNGK